MFAGALSLEWLNANFNTRWRGGMAPNPMLLFGWFTTGKFYLLLLSFKTISEHLKKTKETREKYKKAIKEAKEKERKEQEKEKKEKESKKKKKKKKPKPRWKR